MTLPDCKNGEARTLALPDELVAIVKRRQQPRLTTTPAGGARIEEQDRVWNDFRRFGVRNLRRADVDEMVTMAITGHKTASVFRRFNIVDERDISQAMKATTEYVARLPSSREEQR